MGRGDAAREIVRFAQNSKTKTTSKAKTDAATTARPACERWLAAARLYPPRASDDPAAFHGSLRRCRAVVRSLRQEYRGCLKPVKPYTHMPAHACERAGVTALTALRLYACVH